MWKLVAAIAIIVVVVMVIRGWMKRHPSKRKKARTARKGTRHLRTRMITRRGGTEHVNMCECGQPVSRCRYSTGKAETFLGMHQKR